MTADWRLIDFCFGQGSYGKKCEICGANDYDGALVHVDGCAEIAERVRELRERDRGPRPPRTYADHLRDWEKARQALAEARELLAPLTEAREMLVPDQYAFSGLSIWVFNHASVMLDGLENLLDATAFKDRAALVRQTEIVQRLGADQPDPS